MAIKSIFLQLLNSFWSQLTISRYKKTTSKSDKKLLAGNIRFKDQLLKTLWSQINKNYFKRLLNEDKLKLDWIHYNVLAKKHFKDKNIYPDYEGFLALLDYFDQLRAIHQPIEDFSTDDQFFYNLLKSYYIKVKLDLPKYLNTKQVSPLYKCIQLMANFA